MREALRRREEAAVDGTEMLRERIHQWDDAAWQLAALALALEPGDEALTSAAAEVLSALGLTPSVAQIGPALRAPLAGQARSPLLQLAAVLSGRNVDWTQQPDEALLAQGRASAQGAAAFAQFVLPQLGDLGERLDRPGARMLDVGTGVGALALAYAEQFPALQIVALDVLPRVLDLARQTIASSAAGRRVQLRLQGVAELSDDEGFDLAWLPAPFVLPEALRTGTARVAAAMRPGGWIMIGHGKYGQDPVQDALARFKTVAYGGTALDGAQAQSLLTAAGCVSTVTVPTPPGAPGMTLGRMP